MYHTLLFDLDNTIYPESSGILNAIRGRIIFYIKTKLGLDNENAEMFRKYCLENFGTTFNGLKQLYGIDENEYLSFVHDIPLSDFLMPNDHYGKIFSNFKQKKVIFSNADAAHINRVLEYLDLKQFFEAIIDIHTLKPYVKPQKESFEIAQQFLGLSNWDGCVFIDDYLPNIKAATELGLFSILINEMNTHDYPTKITSLMELPDLLNNN